MFSLRSNVSGAIAPPAPAGIVLPKDVLARMRVGLGDAVYLPEAPDGVRLTAVDPGFPRSWAAKMDAAEEIMREDRDILRELAA